MQRFQPSPHDLEIACHELMKDCLDGTAECVLTTEEGRFVGERGRCWFACSIIGSARRGRFQDIEGEAQTLEGAVDVIFYAHGE